MMHIYFVSLGCDKNLVDSEKMLALLTKEGYELTDEPEQAEIIVVNTCAFIHDAKQESIETLLELAEYKKTGKCKVLIASGCLAERYQDTILEEMPEIDGVIGTTAYDDIAVVVKKALGGEHAALTKELDYLPVHLTDRVTSGMSHVGYLKISEGCNKNCTYCIIPSMRGHYRSVPMEDLIEEAEKLAEKGIRELILVAQETTSDVCQRFAISPGFEFYTVIPKRLQSNWHRNSAKIQRYAIIWIFRSSTAMTRS